MARVVNPDFGSGSSVVGEMLFFLALAAFVIMDGHLLLVDTLVHSFHTVPLGGYVPDGELLFVITGMLSTMVNLAVKVAAPLLCMIFLETIAMGFIARTVPQLNILSLGFPLRILVGLGVVVLTLMAHYRAIEHALRESLSLLYSMF
jgi:flagellar biosynthesis protein FliR